MFEVGRLIARIQLEGSQQFGRDVGSMRKEFAGLDADGRKASDGLGKGLGVVGVGITALAGLAITKFASFDKAMSKVSATTGASASMMDKLRKAAIEAGGATVFSAEEAAQAQVELAKAGIATSDILSGALSGSLALAAAGEIAVADAAETAATAMTQFQLSGKDVPHIADLLAAAAGKAQGGVSDMSMALKQAGLVASQMGLSVDDTVGTLAAFASAGLIGSDAGTSFRTMLLSLANPSAEASALMKEYNLEAYDAQGNFIGMTGLAGKLEKGLKGKTQAERDSTLATIFGSDAIRAANVLMTQGAEGLQKWIDKTNDAGYAARQAAEQQNNLAGDVEKLGGAFDSALIQSGAGANDVLRDMVQAVTGLLDAWSGLPVELQQTGAGLVVVAGVAALAGAAFLLGVPKIVAFRVAMQTLNTQVPALSGNLGKTAAFLTGPWGVALVAAATGLSIFEDVLSKAKATSQEMVDTITTASSAQTIFAKAAQGTPIETYDLSLKGLNKDLKLVAESQKNAWTQYSPDFMSRGIPRLQTLLKNVGEELGGIAATDLPSAQRGFALLAEKTDGSDAALTTLLDSMPAYRDALITQAAAQGQNVDEMSAAERQTLLLELAQGKAVSAAEEQAAAYGTTAEQVESLTEQLQGLIDTTNEANEVGQDAESVNIAYADTLAETQQRIDDITNGVEGFERGISLATEAQRRNREQLVGQAEDSQAAAQAQFNLTGDSQAYYDALVAGRDKMIANAEAMGATTEEATALADSVYKIPTKRQIDIIAKTAAAAAMIQRFRDMVNAIPGSKIVSVGVQYPKNYVTDDKLRDAITRPKASGGQVKFFAQGGENRAPQFAEAGTYRVWAEPETQGEWYYPENPAHRGAGLDNARRMLAGWGYDVVKAGTGRAAAAPSFDDGGRPQKSGGDFIVNIQNPVSRDPVKEIRDWGDNNIAGGRL